MKPFGEAPVCVAVWTSRRLQFPTLSIRLGRRGVHSHAGYALVDLLFGVHSVLNGRARCDSSLQVCKKRGTSHPGGVEPTCMDLAFRCCLASSCLVQHALTATTVVLPHGIW